MTYLYIYIACVFITQVLLAIYNPRATVRDIIAASYLWPITVIVLLADRCRWDIDVQASKNKFGFRRRQNSKYPGFAITIFNIEYQFWKRDV